MDMDGEEHGHHQGITNTFATGHSAGNDPGDTAAGNKTDLLPGRTEDRNDTRGTRLAGAEAANHKGTLEKGKGKRPARVVG